MPSVTIDDKGCRGCTLCVDVCPVDVFDFDAGQNLAKATRGEDCIGCLSCFYQCPSQCLQLADYEEMRPFHRIADHAVLVKKLLQAKTTARDITVEDWEEAYKDVSVRLNALSQAIVETMGRGCKTVGRSAGTTAAEHLPEMYEETSIEDLLKRMQARFKGAYVFDYTLGAENSIDLTFHPCGLYDIVTAAGEKAGEATLCQVFHEYWAGLMSSFSGQKYKVSVPQAGQTCIMKLTL